MWGIDNPESGGANTPQSPSSLGSNFGEDLESHQQ